MEPLKSGSPVKFSGCIRVEPKHFSAIFFAFSSGFAWDETRFFGFFGIKLFFIAQAVLRLV